MGMEVFFMPTKTSFSFPVLKTYAALTELLWSLGEPFSVQSIGTSATGKGMYALTIGEPRAPMVVYAGADRFSATVLLHFAISLPTLLSQNATLHRIHLPTLLAHRRIGICPFLCPDAFETAPSLTNGLGVFLPDLFGSVSSVTKRSPLLEKAPEAWAWQQYLAYTEPALLCVFQKADDTRLYPACPQVSTDHLASRLLSATPELTASDPPASFPILQWYTAETGHPSYGITLSQDADPWSFLVTSPLLIKNTVP